jgi:hypothetical protein
VLALVLMSGCSANTPPAVGTPPPAEPPAPCAPGTTRREGAAASECLPCEAGTHCPGGDAPKAGCAPGSWDHDGMAATACTPWTSCAPGERVLTAGSPTTNQTCAGCASGTFSAQPNLAACTPWRTCPAGTFVSTAASAVSDRACSACPQGTFSSAPDQARCQPAGACPAGTVQRTAATPTSAAQCEGCEPGSWCAGGAATPMPCAAGTWDDDAAPATPCVAWTTCTPGQRVSTVGSARSDRTCAGCASGTFTTTANAATCATWTTCAAGAFVSATGGPAVDQTCTPCPANTFTSAANQAACLPQGACPAGTEQTAAGTATSAPVCTPCPAGTFCAGGAAPRASCPSGTWDHDGDAATACVGHTVCVAGQRVAQSGSATTDRGCQPCASGTFSAQPNSAACTAWAVCAAGSEQSAAGSATSDRTCAACPTGTFCAGGAAPAVSCGSLRWDHDANSATPCWSPALLPDLVLWLDGADVDGDGVQEGIGEANVVVQASQAFVERWEDKSPARRAATASSAQRPTLQPGAVNALPAVRFDGTDDRMLLPAGVYADSAKLLVVVSKSVTGTAIAVTLQGSSTEKMLVLDYTTSNFWFASRGSTQQAFNVTTTGTNLYFADFPGNAPPSSALFNGGVPPTGADFGPAGGLDSNVNSVGFNPDRTMNFLNGFIPELVVTSSLSVANRQLLEGYLARKWGVQASLPAGHPYR